MKPKLLRLLCFATSLRSSGIRGSIYTASLNGKTLMRTECRRRYDGFGGVVTSRRITPRTRRDPPMEPRLRPSSDRPS